MIDVQNLTGILFYIFSFILVLSAFFAVTVKKSVNAVLLLILAFFAAAWVFLTLGAEFIAMLLIIIYVGAIAVLFLFVVMMLEEPNSVIKKAKHGKINFLFSFGIGSILFFEIFTIILTTKIANKPAISMNFGIKDIGNILYTEYFFEFQTIGLLFFTAMVGAIILTLIPSVVKTKRQNFFKQISRDTTSVYLTNPEIGKGVKI